jgi:hypothetical protein
MELGQDSRNKPDKGLCEKINQENDDGDRDYQR